MLMGEITGVATNLMTSGNSFPFLTSVFHCIHVSVFLSIYLFHFWPKHLNNQSTSYIYNYKAMEEIYIHYIDRERSQTRWFTIITRALESNKKKECVNLWFWSSNFSLDLS